MTWFSNSLNPARKWGLAAGALIIEQQGDNSHDRLKIKQSRRKTRRRLVDGWEIEDRIKLLETLVWLAESGHRTDYAEAVELTLEEKSANSGFDENDSAVHEPLDVFILKSHREMQRLGFLAWDLVRLIDLARRGFRVGYLEEPETWVWINHAALRLQEEFKCWEDMGRSWVLGFSFWTRDQGYDDEWEIKAAKACDRLAHGHKSPWRGVDWDTSLKISPEQRLQEVIDSSPKNYCEECDSQLLMGGELVRDYRFCNWKCARQSESLRHIPDFPEDIVQSAAITVQQSGSCPRCGTDVGSPIEVHAFHYVVAYIVSQNIRSDAVFSCRFCGWKRQAGHMLITMLAGWWSKSGMIFSPVQITRTFFALFSSPKMGNPSEKLRHYVRRQMAEDLVPHAMLRARFSRAELQIATGNHPLPDRDTCCLALVALSLAGTAWASMLLTAFIPFLIILSAIVITASSFGAVICGHLAYNKIRRNHELLGLRYAVYALLFAYPIVLTLIYLFSY